MLTKEIIEFVKKEVLNHKSWNQIRTELLLNNWSETDIKSIYASVFTDEQASITEVKPFSETPKRSNIRAIVMGLIVLIIVAAETVYFLSNSDQWLKVKGSALLMLAKIDTSNASKYFSLLDSKEFPSNKASSENNANKKTSKVIELEEVNNVGYRFYMGVIDNPQKTIVDISNLSKTIESTPKVDESDKKYFTEVMFDAKFPKKLLDTTAIVIVNTLAANNFTSIKSPDGKFYPIPRFEGEFIKGGGIYSHKIGNFSFIFINADKTCYRGCILPNLNLAGLLTHEFGHAIGSQLSEDEWKQYYILRNIPTNEILYNPEWSKSPFEDFAEVYRYISVSKYYHVELRETVPSIQTIYGNSVDQSTTDFVNNILNRLNR